MNTLQFLIQTIIGVYIFILVAKTWLQYCRVDFYNPLSQTLVKLTQPVLAPLRKIVPMKYNIDFAALLVAFILGAVKLPLLYWLMSGTLSLELPYLLLLGILSVAKAWGEIIFWAIFLRAIMSWFSRGNNPLDYVLYQISEPLLAPIRRILPSTGMLDFSVMVLGIILFLLNNVLLDIFGQLWLIA
ncbi:YggT family protein [Gallibacterium salpingitidis]|uniref:Membrane protein n=1 Tax=Gallibacterium salpingitidis TaxID=505341 RepID=A0A1A7NY54_9PAST|nr:YggT family protein [Gallibacterium salpingitidis]OBW94643.1 membrane protein [Gallibacterium salpingitidis]